MTKESIRNKVVGASVFACSMLAAVPCFAAEPDVTAAMTTAFTAVQTQFNSVVTVVAPVALTIMGTFLVWRLGTRFFKSLAK